MAASAEPTITASMEPTTVTRARKKTVSLNLRDFGFAFSFSSCEEEIGLPTLSSSSGFPSNRELVAGCLLLIVGCSAPLGLVAMTDCYDWRIEVEGSWLLDDS